MRTGTSRCRRPTAMGPRGSPQPGARLPARRPLQTSRIPRRCPPLSAAATGLLACTTPQTHTAAPGQGCDYRLCMYLLAPTRHPPPVGKVGSAGRPTMLRCYAGTGEALALCQHAGQQQGRADHEPAEPGQHVQQLQHSPDGGRPPEVPVCRPQHVQLPLPALGEHLPAPAHLSWLQQHQVTHPEEGYVSCGWPLLTSRRRGQ